MTESSIPERRAFLGKLAASAVAIGLTGSVSEAFAAERRPAHDIKPSDKWLESVTGKHRQFFGLKSIAFGVGVVWPPG